MVKTPNGYYGVIIPKYDYYQGFFLYEDPATPEYLKLLRRAPLHLAKIGRPTPGVADEDQALLGGLCATLVHGARASQLGSADRRKILDPQRLLLRAGAAISAVTHDKYFMVRGEIDSTGGIWTDFWRMPLEVNSQITAVAYIHSLPDVQLIQGKLLKEAAELALKEKRKQ